MGGAKRVDDLEAYKLAVQVRRRIFQLTKRMPVASDFKFAGQIRDAARGRALIERTNGAVARLMEYLESPSARRFYEEHRTPEPPHPEPRRSQRSPRARYSVERIRT
jgi:hypothetical protein